MCNIYIIIEYCEEWNIIHSVLFIVVYNRLHVVIAVFCLLKISHSCVPDSSSLSMGPPYLYGGPEGTYSDQPISRMDLNSFFYTFLLLLFLLLYICLCVETDILFKFKAKTITFVNTSVRKHFRCDSWKMFSDSHPALSAFKREVEPRAALNCCKHSDVFNQNSISTFSTKQTYLRGKK